VRQYRNNDMHTLRRAVMANAEEYLTNEVGFRPDRRVENVRLFAGALSALCGVLSHFSGIPFADAKPLIIGCVVLYNILGVFLFYISRYVEGDTFFSASGELTSATTVGSIAQLGRGKRFRLAVRLEGAFRPYLLLEAQLLAPSFSAWRPPVTLRTVEKKLFAGRFFDADGHIFPPEVKRSIDEVLRDLLRSSS